MGESTGRGSQVAGRRARTPRFPNVCHASWSSEFLLLPSASSNASQLSEDISSALTPRQVELTDPPPALSIRCPLFLNVGHLLCSARLVSSPIVQIWGPSPGPKNEGKANSRQSMQQANTWLGREKPRRDPGFSETGTLTSFLRQRCRKNRKPLCHMPSKERAWQCSVPRRVSLLMPGTCTARGWEGPGCMGSKACTDN